MRKALAQERNQFITAAVAGRQGEIDDGDIHCQPAQAANELIAAGVAGDDVEADVAGQVQDGAAADDFVIVEECQPQSARCRVSIHALGGDRRPKGVAIILALLSRRASNLLDFCDYS